MNTWSWILIVLTAYKLISVREYSRGTNSSTLQSFHGHLIHIIWLFASSFELKVYFVRNYIVWFQQSIQNPLSLLKAPLISTSWLSAQLAAPQTLRIKFIVSRVSCWTQLWQLLFFHRPFSFSSQVTASHALKHTVRLGSLRRDLRQFFARYSGCTRITFNSSKSASRWRIFIWIFSKDSVFSERFPGASERYKCCNAFVDSTPP